MDGHFGNMRTDMERIYLTDFGLATSPHFDLSTAEHDFVRRHATHDADYAAMLLVNWPGDRGLRGTEADERRTSRPQRVRTPVRHRSYSR